VAREEKPAFIHLKTTCLPELVGDTPIPFIARIESELGVPVLWTSKTHNSGPVYEAMVERLLGEVEFASVRDPKAVLLAGLPSEAAQKEAVELCGALGLRVVGTAFPNLDFRGYPEIGTAGSVIWYNPVGWAKISDDVFLRRGLRVVRHHPPFGVSGTQGWLARVAAVLGLPASADALSLEPLKAELEALALECRKRTVALVGDTADIELLASRGRAFGFSAAGMLCDLGFNVRCLVWTPGGGVPARALRRPKAARGGGTIEFLPFSSRAQLDRFLGRGIDLVFTHFNHDPRLEAHGLRGFNDNAFEPGLEGLIRTGRGLLMKCAARPFPRHRACLTPWKI
ncbi:MAG: nitrogenase component 1, partial [Elusimicrobia bacterium]|nr:nitrogenase component 1 [Elusimicrobiota bacterium]